MANQEPRRVCMGMRAASGSIGSCFSSVSEHPLSRSSSETSEIVSASPACSALPSSRLSASLARLADFIRIVLQVPEKSMIPIGAQRLEGIAIAGKVVELTTPLQ